MTSLSSFSDKGIKEHNARCTTYINSLITGQNMYPCRNKHARAALCTVTHNLTDGHPQTDVLRLKHLQILRHLSTTQKHLSYRHAEMYNCTLSSFRLCGLHIWTLCDLHVHAHTHTHMHRTNVYPIPAAARREKVPTNKPDPTATPLI